MMRKTSDIVIALNISSDEYLRPGDGEICGGQESGWQNRAISGQYTAEVFSSRRNTGRFCIAS